MINFKDLNTVLVVDDEQEQCEALKMILQGNYTVLTSSNPQEALDTLNSMKGKIDVVMLDIKMPQMDGLQLLQSIKKIAPEIEAVFITGFPSTKTAVQALKYGAYDYIVKPFDKETVEQVVRKGVDRRLRKKLKEKWLII